MGAIEIGRSSQVNILQFKNIKIDREMIALMSKDNILF